MARLKLTVFAALALMLGLVQFSLSASSDTASAVASAQGSADGAEKAVDAAMAVRRAEVGDLALAVAENPQIAALLAQARPPRVDPPTPAVFQKLREQIATLTPAALKGAVVVGWSNSAGALFARDGQPPASQVPGIDPGLAAPSNGTAVLEGALYRVIAISIPGKVSASVIIAAPELTPAALDELAKGLGLQSLAVLSSGQVVVAGGPGKASVGAAVKAVAPNARAVLTRGAVSSFGPIGLPVLSNGDLFGGGAPLEVMARHGLAQPGLEVAAVAGTREALKGVVENQQRAMVLFAVALVVFAISLGWIAVDEREDEEGDWQPLAPPEPAADAPERQGGETPSWQAPSPVQAGPDPSELQAAPEASPDDFDFASAMQQLPPPGGTPASGTAFGGIGPEFDADRTTMYPTSANGTTQLPALSEQAAQEAEAEHDATRVATVPNDLLQASVRRGAEGRIPPAPERKAAPPPVDPEEAHFQEVFQAFLSVREQCGEVGENPSYDKFAAKLRKNREALVQKYSCRTVRFQVYVKEGKAALKATPVKE